MSRDRRLADADMTADQAYCTETLAEWALGRHHLPRVYEFGAGVCINWYGDLSTHDFDRLTRLVLLAHRDAVRIEIASSGPRMVRIIAHRRTPGRSGTMPQSVRHPTLDELAERISVTAARKHEGMMA